MKQSDENLVTVMKTNAKDTKANKECENKQNYRGCAIARSTLMLEMVVYLYVHKSRINKSCSHGQVEIVV